MASDESLGRDETFLSKTNHCNILTLLVVELHIMQLGILRPDCHGTSVKRDVWQVSSKTPDESLGRNETYVYKN